MTGLEDNGEIPLSRLLQDLEDGVITPADRERLMRQLRQSPAACELYLKHIRLASLLRQTAENRIELGTMPVSMEMLARAKRKSAVTALLGGIAAVLVLALTLMAFQVRITLASKPPRIAMDASQDAAYEVEWAGNVARDHGQLRPGDRVMLDRGLLRFTFPSKVEALIEGPADLELLSTSEIRLHGGMSWFRVPREGRGFTVRTDRAEIIDLGTEFGLWFDADRSLQVHVANGTVRVESRTVGGGGARELTSGEAITIDERGEVRGMDARAGVFRRRFTHAVPSLHWSFDFLVDGAFPASGTLPDAAEYRAHLRHVGGTITPDDLRHSQGEGVRGKSFAMHGDGVFAESAFPGIGGNAPRTVAAWIRHSVPAPEATDDPHRSDPWTGHGATTPFGDQAYLLNYTNAGLSTTQGAFREVITAGTTYTLGFHTASLPELRRGDYHVELVAFDPTHDDAVREDMRQGYRAGTVLAQMVGQTTATDMSNRDEIVFTVADDDASLGRDLGIRLVNSGHPVLYDNLRLTRKTRNGETTVIFEESFESPVVTGYAEYTRPERHWIGPVAGVKRKLHLGFGARRHGLFSQRPVFSAPFLAWDGGSRSRFAAFILPTGPPRWSVACGTAFRDALPSDPIPAEEWTHVATVHTGRNNGDGQPEILHYINGRRVEGGYHAHGRPDSPLTAAPVTLHIGSLPGTKPGTPTLTGGIDELHILRAALDEAEIRSLMDDNRARFERRR